MTSTIGFIGVQEPETEKLPLYFSQRGFLVHHWSGLVEASGLSVATSAIVLFADAFEATAIVAWLRLVLKAVPTRLVIVLTAAPGNFTGPTALGGDNVLLLVRPVLAWHLVDVIRNHVGATA